MFNFKFFFLIDGKFIFQLAAHHQQNPYNNRYTSCRWIPVPTVLQQHKNSVKNVSEWPQHQQNKTIWPYLVTNTGSDSLSPQPTQQSQSPAITKIGERRQQQNKHRTTPPPHIEPCTVNVTTPTAVKVVAMTTNIIRRPPRKCSNTTATENSINLQPQHWQPQPQLRLVSRRSQHHHQSFVMVATKAIKAQRRLMPKKRRRMPRVSAGQGFSVGEKQQPPLNLESTVRYLWRRRHTSELLLRRQMSLNNSGVDCVDSAPPSSRHVVGNGDSTCPINMDGGSKRRSAVLPLSNSIVSTVVSTMTTTTSSMSIAENNTGNSSPNKKCRFGQQQQQQILQPKQPATVDGGAKKSAASPSPQLSTNDHSITAILSGSAVGAKRNCGVVAATTRANLDSCTTTTITSTVVTPPKNLPSTSAPLSLLRTLLKSPGGAEGGSPTIVTSNNDGSGYRQQHTIIGSRKRSAVESLVVSPIQPPPPVIRPTVDNPGTSMMAFPTVASAISPVNDTTVALSALHQLPTLHHPAAAAAAAAGYFNVLYYHQAAMAAAMAYQTHAQLPQPLSKPQLQPPPLMSSQFTTIAGSSWQQQLNQRIHLPALETSRANKVTTATISSSPSTVVAPYSSPLVASTVNGGSLLPPATPSPPPLLLHTHPAHHHHLMLHHQQQYLPVPKLQPPLLSKSYQQHKSQSRGVKKRTQMTMGENAMGSVAKVVKEESPSSTGKCTSCFIFNLYSFHIMFFCKCF